MARQSKQGTCRRRSKSHRRSKRKQRRAVVYRGRRAAFGPGDVLDISVNVEGTILKDTLTISRYDPSKSILYTCGHCMPPNARVTSTPCELMFTSGYDTPGDEVEIAQLRVLDPSQFTNQIDGRPTKVVSKAPKVGSLVSLRHSQKTIQGMFAGTLTDSNVVVFDGCLWSVTNLPRVRRPCHIIAGVADDGYRLPTRHGFSGSPWFFTENGRGVSMFGYHVAKVGLRNGKGYAREASVAMPYVL